MNRGRETLNLGRKLAMPEGSERMGAVAGDGTKGQASALNLSMAI